MAHYKESLKLLFTCWSKTYELSSCIIQEAIRKNALRKVEAGYRRFQREVESSYDRKQEIDDGLIRYYQVETERQYKSILEYNHLLLKNKSFRYVNPWPKRMEDFQNICKNRTKVDFSTFIAESDKK